MNDRGDVAFITSLDDGVPGDLRGLFASNDLGEVVPLVFTGSEIDINADPLVDDLRIVMSFGASSLNNWGELLVKAFFTDGSDGAFVVNIPAPSSFVMRLLLERWQYAAAGDAENSLEHLEPS